MPLMVVLPLSVVVLLTLVGPFKPTAPVPVENVFAPVWLMLPPKVLEPPATLKALVPVMVVAPFRLTLPVPVENVPAPL